MLVFEVELEDRLSGPQIFKVLLSSMSYGCPVHSHHMCLLPAPEAPSGLGLHPRAFGVAAAHQQLQATARNIVAGPGRQVQARMLRLLVTCHTIQTVEMCTGTAYNGLGGCAASHDTLYAHIFACLRHQTHALYTVEETSSAIHTPADVMQKRLICRC